MRSIIVRDFGGPDRIEIADTPLPEPGPGQVRVRVAAASVNPIDLSARAGRLAGAGLMVPRFPVSLGWDVAGYVDAVGPAGTPTYAVGDRVIGLRDLLFMPGTHADHVVLDASAVAPAPKTVPVPVAATLPLNALTADTSLRLAGLRRGGTLLVTGAAGGVGGFAVELARLHGLRTVALAREHDADSLLARGAAAVVTESGALGAAVRAIVPGGVDAVIDAAVLGIGAHEALRDGGTFVTLVRPFAPPPIRGTRVVVAEVSADGARLTELAALLDFGVVTSRVAATYRLDEAARAHEQVEKGGVRGRVVLVP